MNPQLPGAPNSPYQDLQKFYDINFQLPLSQAGIKVLTGQDKAREKQREFDTRQKISDLQAKASGEGFQRFAKDDGGWGFRDSEGNEISAYQYARATGKSVFDVLSDSENPIDIGFREDYKNLQEFLQAATRGDEQMLEEYYRERPELRRMSPRDVLERFKQAYPTVYGGNRPGQPVGSTYIPTLYDVAGGGGVGG